MAQYKIEILPSVVRKDLAKMPKTDVVRIMEHIKLLGENPRPTWSKKLYVREEYRTRQGKYRILYIIGDSMKIIQVVKVGHRRNIYGG